MTDGADRFPTSLVSYSPQRRTALVLTGTGADGAYHAGVLRALQEVGVKVDIIGARGVGVIGALFAAVDGAQRLWEEKGFWRGGATHVLYRWGRIPQLIAWALALSLAIVVVPLVAAACGLIVFPIDFLLKMVGAGGAPGLLDAYLRVMQAAFAPEALPTWLPRLVLLVLGFSRRRRARAGLGRGVAPHARRVLVARGPGSVVVDGDGRALLARDVGPDSRRHAAEGAVARGAGAAIHRDARGEHRAAGIP